MSTRKDHTTASKAKAKRSACFVAANLLIGLLLLTAGGAQGSVIPITSITEISGITINFEQPGGTANAILPTFDIVAVPDALITTLIPAVTGNSSAPIAGRALFSEGFLIETTGLPWVQIGLTGVGTLFGESRILTLTAFDSKGLEVGSITRPFAPTNSTISANNAAAVFLGLGSATPIRAIELTSDNPNVAWDNLRFNPVPEPSILLLLSCGLAGIALVINCLSFASSGPRGRRLPEERIATENTRYHCFKRIDLASRQWQIYL